MNVVHINWRWLGQEYNRLHSVRRDAYDVYTRLDPDLDEEIYVLLNRLTDCIDAKLKQHIAKMEEGE